MGRMRFLSGVAKESRKPAAAMPWGRGKQKKAGRRAG